MILLQRISQKLICHSPNAECRKYPANPRTGSFHILLLNESQSIFEARHRTVISYMIRISNHHPFQTDEAATKTAALRKEQTAD